MRANEHQSNRNTAQPGSPGAVRAWFVYMVECCDGTLYTGCTTDVSRRLHEHNSTSRGAKYTRSRRPVMLRYHAACNSRSEALREELRIKRLSRADKLALIVAGTEKI